MQHAPYVTSPRITTSSMVSTKVWNMSAKDVAYRSKPSGNCSARDLTFACLSRHTVFCTSKL